MNLIVTKTLSLLTLAALSCLFACQQVLDYIPTDNPKKNIIDEKGGELSSDGMNLFIPQGSFVDDETITIETMSEDGPYEEVRVTKRYRIEGIPENYQHPLRIALEHNGETGEDVWISVGMNSMEPDRETELDYFLLEATDSAGFLVTSLPVRGNHTSLKSLSETDLIIEGYITKIGTQITNDGHFKLVWLYQGQVPDKLPFIGEQLEEAYSFIVSELGFDISLRTKWPLIVRIMQGSFDDHSISHSVWGHNYSEILLSDMYFSISENSLGRSLFSILYNFIIDLYNPYSNYLQWLTMRQADPGNEFEWFIQASEEWVASKYDNNYLQLYSTVNYQAPLHGFQYGAQGSWQSANYHGDGMYPWILEMVTKYGDQILKATWENYKSGSGILSSMILYTDVPFVWLSDFYESLIYNYLHGSGIYVNPDKSFTLSQDHPEETYANQFPDLSGKIIDISFSGELSPKASLEVRLTNGDPLYDQISVYKNTNEDHKFLGNGSLNYKITNIQEYPNDGSSLRFIVSHAKAQKPYLGTTPLEINFKLVDEEPEPTIDYITWTFSFNTYWDGKLNNQDWDNQFIAFVLGNPTFSGSGVDYPPIYEIEEDTYSQAWSYEYETYNGLTYEVEGRFELTLSPEHDKVISYDLSYSEVHKDEGYEHDYERSYTISGICDIPMAFTNSMHYRISGSDVCPNISLVEGSRQEPNGDQATLVDFDCGDNARIEFKIVMK